MLEPVVRAQRAQERLLPRVLGALPEQPAQVAEHLVAVREVEAFERRYRLGHLFPIIDVKRGRVRVCEMRRRRTRRVGRVRARPARAGRRARSSTPTRPGRSPPAAARWSRARSRGSRAAASSSPRSATTSSARLGARARRARHRRPRPSGSGRQRRRRGCTSIARRRADDHRRSATSSCRTGRCPLDGYDLVFFVVGDGRGAALGAGGALSARPRCASCRRCEAAGVPLDLLVGSANDPGERVRRLARRGARGSHRRRARRDGERRADTRRPRRRTTSSTATARATRSPPRLRSRSRAATNAPGRSSSPRAPEPPCSAGGARTRRS